MKQHSVLAYLLTRSCSFCIGSGSPSRPHVSISLPSYTLMIRSAVFMRKQLHKKQNGFKGKKWKHGRDGKNTHKELCFHVCGHLCISWFWPFISTTYIQLHPHVTAVGYVIQIVLSTQAKLQAGLLLCSLSPALPCKFNGFDGGGVAGASGHSEGCHQLLGICV